MKDRNNEKTLLENELALFIKKNVLNLKIFNKILIISVVVLGVFYIAGTNDLSIRGFALSDLKEQRNKLADENKKLEIEAMTLSSYSIISVKVANLKMVAVGEIDYINGSKEVVAKK